MATSKKVWKSAATIAATDGYGGSTPDLAADEAWDFTSDIDLETDGYDTALIYLEHDSSGTTDNIVMAIFPSIDGTDRADNPVSPIEYDATAGTDTQEPPIVVKDLQHFAVGVKTTGSTDTFDYRIRWTASRRDVS